MKNNKIVTIGSGISQALRSILNEQKLLDHQIHYVVGEVSKELIEDKSLEKVDGPFYVSDIDTRLTVDDLSKIDEIFKNEHNR